MPIRSMKVPDDLDLMLQMILDSFQYPENPDWNIQQDTVDSITETVEGFKKLWLLMKIFGIFSYQIRNSNRGYIWEEDDQPAGLISVHSKSKEEWLIGNVGVLPEFRRRGIARKLMENGLEYVRQEGAKRVYLQVIDGNYPAQTLYKKLGFVDYLGNREMEHPGGEVEAPVLPERYTEEPYGRFDWETKYEHTKNITPPEVSKYAPVKEKDFHTDFFIKLFVPFFDKAQGLEKVQYVYRDRESGEIAGRFGVGLRSHPGGVCDAFARLTPGHPDLGAYMMQKILHLCYEKSPGRRISMDMPDWQVELMEAAEKAGFTAHVEYREMALLLKEE